MPPKVDSNLNDFQYTRETRTNSDGTKSTQSHVKLHWYDGLIIGGATFVATRAWKGVRKGVRKLFKKDTVEKHAPIPETPRTEAPKPAPQIFTVPSDLFKSMDGETGTFIKGLPLETRKPQLFKDIVEHLVNKRILKNDLPTCALFVYRLTGKEIPNMPIDLEATITWNGTWSDMLYLTQSLFIGTETRLKAGIYGAALKFIECTEGNVDPQQASSYAASADDVFKAEITEIMERYQKPAKGQAQVQK